jgi:hypothetical protein
MRMHDTGAAAGPAVSLGSAGGGEAPPIVHEVLRSPGQPLDRATREFMEPRFGHDFSSVRVHTDAKAAASAGAVQAKAYTVGQNVVFGAGTFAPGTQAGQRLVAHELTHVMQQDGSPNPALQMKPVSTWAGEFDTDLYGLFKSTRQGDLDTYGVGIRLKFTPGAHVDADKIAMVQTAQSQADGKPRVTYRDPKGITSTRMTSIDKGDPQTGIHIDAWPDERTPVSGMTTAKNQSELSESSLPTAPSAEDDICAPGTTSFGSRSKGKKPVEAKICDIPSLSLRDGEAASQHFETTALAVEGMQKGTFYGSVSWGWEKNAGSVKAKILDLQSVSKDVPSSDFAQAADLWNKSQTGTGKKTIPLPIGELKFTSKNTIDLVDEPSHKKPKTLGHLVLNTQVEVIEGIVSTNPDWARVVVIDGKLAGTAGWIRKETLADRKTDIEKAEPKRKK